MAKATQRRKNLFGFGDSRKRTRAQEQADRLGERTRISASRAETAGRGLKSSKPVAEKTYRYQGETITKRGDEYWLNDGSAFESLAVAKGVIRSLKKNPKKKSHYGEAVLSSALSGSPIPLGAEILRNPANNSYDPKWMKVRGVDAIGIPGMDIVGVPVSGRRNASRYSIIDVKRKEELTQLDRGDVRGWLIRKAKDLGIPFNDFYDVRTKRNPEDSAEELYEKFHGVPSEESIVIEEEHHFHSNLTALGVLIEIKVKTVMGPKATLRFSHKGEEDTVYLASNEAGTQLFLENGDQCLDLEALGFDAKMANRDSVLIGSLRELTYRTRKKFDKMRETDYYHKLGEESGEFPVLLYDTINQKMSVSGGAYEILAPGITD